VFPNRINIDTGPFATGRLTCLRDQPRSAALFVYEMKWLVEYVPMPSSALNSGIRARPNLSTHFRCCESQSSEIGLHKRSVLFAPKNRLRQLGTLHEKVRGLLIGDCDTMNTLTRKLHD
jgi:hypothetical protein